MSDEQPERQDDERGTGAQREPDGDRRTGEASTAPAAQPRQGGAETTA